MTENIYQSFSFTPEDSDTFVAKRCTGGVNFVAAEFNAVRENIAKTENPKPRVIQKSNPHPALEASDVRGMSLRSSLEELVRNRKGN